MINALIIVKNSRVKLRFYAAINLADCYHSVIDTVQSKDKTLLSGYVLIAANNYQKDTFNKQLKAVYLHCVVYRFKQKQGYGLMCVSVFY